MPDPMLFLEIVVGATGVVIGIIYVFINGKRVNLDTKEFPDKDAAKTYKDQFDKGANK